MKQQQIKKLYFLIWLDCFLGAALSSTNFFSSARPLGRASWKEKKCCWWTAAISLLHQQPPVINQPSTCLISTYVCFLSIDILTVIISIEFIPFVLSLINQMKRNQLKVLLLIEWVDWWLIKEREQLLPSLKKFHFFKLRHKRLYVVGPAASLINSSINSFTFFTFPSLVLTYFILYSSLLASFLLERWVGPRRKKEVSVAPPALLACCVVFLF